jgi:hypothetical protein
LDLLDHHQVLVETVVLGIVTNALVQIVFAHRPRIKAVKSPGCTHRTYKYTSSTDLERLESNRFETFNLYRKLLAQMGETNLAVLRSTSLLKRLVGQDMIPFEAKGRGTFIKI